MLKRPKLLITDDDRDFRETLQGVFRSGLYQTLLAANGEEAIRIVSEYEVHVVLMDYQMPRLSGIEAVRKMRAENARLPCILISGAIDERIEAEAESVNVYSILRKPIQVEEVRRCVGSALRDAYGWTPSNPAPQSPI